MILWYNNKNPYKKMSNDQNTQVQTMPVAAPVPLGAPDQDIDVFFAAPVPLAASVQFAAPVQSLLDLDHIRYESKERMMDVMINNLASIKDYDIKDNQSINDHMVHVYGGSSETEFPIQFGTFDPRTVLRLVDLIREGYLALGIHVPTALNCIEHIAMDEVLRHGQEDIEEMSQLAAGDFSDTSPRILFDTFFELINSDEFVDAGFGNLIASVEDVSIFLEEMEDDEELDTLIMEGHEGV